MRKKAAKKLFKSYGVKLLNWEGQPPHAARIQLRNRYVVIIYTHGGKCRVEPQLKAQGLHPVPRTKWTHKKRKRPAPSQPATPAAGPA